MGLGACSGYDIYVADAFAEQIFGGNQAGVVVLGEEQSFPHEKIMRGIAGEMKHSETAFVKRVGRNAFRVRYFTPMEEVALCGHATIGAFGTLYQEEVIGDGSYRLYPGAPKEGQQPLEVQVSGGNVWMDMASPRVEGELNREQAMELYEAFGLRPETGKGLLPAIVNTGLSDIMLPVADRESLERAVLDCRRITELSLRYHVVGVHMFCLNPRDERPGQCCGLDSWEAGGGLDSAAGVTARCRNFAPAVGIDEESATGTSNGALTWYLYRKGLLPLEGEHLFLQGEAMGKPSLVKSRIKEKPEGMVIQIGGRAQIALKGRIYAEGVVE